MQYFGSLGLPPALAYFDMMAEVVDGDGLIVGFYSRIAAIALF